MRAIAHLMGIGLASTNRFLCKGNNFICSCIAPLALPATAATHSSCISLGAMLAVTLTLPWPPHSISATAVASSPEYTAKPLGASLINHCARSILPVASLMPTMPGTCANRITVACAISATVRPGTLYKMQGKSPVASAIALKCWYWPSCVGLL